MRVERASRIFAGPSCAILAASALILGSTGVLAAGARAPRVCDQVDSGERIKCKTANVIDQQAASVEMMMDIPNLSETQKGRLHNQMDGASHAMERTSGTDFHELTRKKQAHCQTLPADPNDVDGVCTGNEMCAELAADGIGNDDGICRTHGKPSEREVCAEICDDEALGQPENFDDDSSNSLSLGGDIETGLDDATAEYVEFNDMLESEMLRRAAARPGVLDTNPCEGALRARADEQLEFGSVYAANLTDAAARTFGPACDLDVSGFNTAPVCIVFEGIAAIATGIRESFFEFEHWSIDSEHIDATLECVHSLSEAAGETEEKLDAVQEQLREVQEQLMLTIELLMTPPGRRAGFPSKHR